MRPTVPLRGADHDEAAEGLAAPVAPGDVRGGVPVAGGFGGPVGRGCEELVAASPAAGTGTGRRKSSFAGEDETLPPRLVEGTAGASSDQVVLELKTPCEA